MTNTTTDTATNHTSTPIPPACGVIIIGKAASGKTLAAQVLAPVAKVIPTLTTREPRKTDDVPDITHLFIDDADMPDEKNLIAYLNTGCVRYGLSKKMINRHLTEHPNQSFVTVLSPQGARDLIKTYPEIPFFLVCIKPITEEARLNARTKRDGENFIENPVLNTDVDNIVLTGTKSDSRLSLFAEDETEPKNIIAVNIVENDYNAEHFGKNLRIVANVVTHSHRYLKLLIAAANAGLFAYDPEQQLIALGVNDESETVSALNIHALATALAIGQDLELYHTIMSHIVRYLDPESIRVIHEEPVTLSKDTYVRNK